MQQQDQQLQESQEISGKGEEIVKKSFTWLN